MLTPLVMLGKHTTEAGCDTMPKNRKLQNIIGTEHITDTAEAAIAAQATVGDIVGDTTPQLGGNLDVNGNDIVSVSNGDIELAANGTGQVIFKGNATKGAGQFKLNCEQNSHGIVIKGPPHSAAASYTLTLPNTDGSADEVLKTDGSGNLDWVAQSGGSSAPDIGLGGIGYIRDCDVFDSSGNSSTAIYCSSLGLGESSSSSFGPALNTGTLTFFPIIMPKAGTLSKLGIRFVGGAGGSDTAFGLYRADSTKLRPTGSVVFSQNFTPTTYTSYDFTASVSVTAGEILWVAWFGYNTSLPTLSSISSSEAGTPNLPAEKSGSLTGLYTAKAKHTFRVSGNTFGTFPTISSSYFDDAFETVQQTILPRIGMVIS